VAKRTQEADLQQYIWDVEHSVSPTASAPKGDINTASVDMLKVKNLIGPKLAKEIVKAREAQPSGRFTSMNDLGEVPGIGYGSRFDALVSKFEVHST
jgi:DNA uptake protein ComE-like DNA-binding protein